MNIQPRLTFSRRALPILLLCGILLSSCAEKSPTEPVVTAIPITIDGQPWKLWAFEQDGSKEWIVDHQLYTIDFRDKAVLSGIVGCNEYTAAYGLDSNGAMTVQNLVSGDEVCPVHRNSERFLAALATAERVELSANLLRVFYEEGRKALVFRMNLPNYETLEIDLDENGTKDIEVIGTGPVEEALQRSGAQFYFVRGVGSNRVLGEPGKYQSAAVSFVKGISIGGEAVPPMEWIQFGDLAYLDFEKEGTVFSGAWAEGIPLYVAVALQRNGETYYGWVLVRILVNGPAPEVRVLDYAVNAQPSVAIITGER